MRLKKNLHNLISIALVSIIFVLLLGLMAPFLLVSGLIAAAVYLLIKLNDGRPL